MKRQTLKHVLLSAGRSLLSVLLCVTSVSAQQSSSASVPLAVQDAAARAATKALVARKLILVGDSTTQVNSGWGGEFCARHVSSFLTCVNLARGGRSSFSYRAEGSWTLALNEMRTPGYEAVYVLIQLGHNDQPGKPGRSTDVQTEFPDNLRAYVREARTAGAIPVLLTPLTRRSFRNGQLQDDLAPWAQAVRTVAAEQRVPLVDLHAMSMAAVQSMGPEASLSLAQVAPVDAIRIAARSGTTISAVTSSSAAGVTSSSPVATETVEQPFAAVTLAFDYTHVGPQGAAVFSALVVKGLAEAVPALRSMLIP